MKALVSGRTLRKVAIAIAGFAVLAVGVLMIVLPGPAVVVIPLGLTILAKEYSWAERLLVRMKVILRSWPARARRLLASMFAFRGTLTIGNARR
jgi:tellurite resistance protein TerC